MTKKIFGRLASARSFVFAIASLAALASQAVSKSYINASGVSDTADCTEITSSTTTLNTGWYVVEGEVTINSSVTVSGDAKLILADGAKLTVTGSAMDMPGICVEVDGSVTNSLSIYCQTAGTGELHASSSSYGPGIGTGGENHTCGKVTIYGGVVNATGSSHGSGIGSGWKGDGGDITINGGTVTAIGGSSAGAGIGGGYQSPGAMVVINGGTVTAAAGSSSYAGIGGQDGKDQGSLTVGENVIVKAGNNESLTDSDIQNPNGETAISLATIYKYYQVQTTGPKPLNQATTALAAYTGENKVWNLADTITGGTKPYTFALKAGSVLPGTLALSGANNATLSGVVSSAGEYVFTNTVTDAAATPQNLEAVYTLTVTAPDPLVATANLGTVKVGKAANFNLSDTISGGVPPYTFAASGSLPTGFSLSGTTLSFTASAAGPYNCAITVTDKLGTTLTPVNYAVEAVESAGFVDDDPEEPESGVQANCRTLEGTYPRTCNLITTSASTVVWDNSWYYVTGDVTLSAGAIVSNKVSLILGDNATLTVVGAYDKAGIAVLPGNTLTIYGQSAGARVGKLVVTGGNGSAGIGGDHRVSCGKVTIYGGDVTATGTGWSAGIGGGDDNQTVGGTIAVYGGKVTANGGHSQPGIGGGYSSSDDGTLTVGDNIIVKAGSNENPTTVLEHGANGAITLQHGSRQYYVIETSGPAPLTQTTSTLVAYTGEAAEFDLAATVSGGTTPYGFALKSGSDYPAGFELSGTTLSCSSASAGGSFIMVVTDSGTGDDAQNEEFTYTITVTPRPQPITYMDGASEVLGLVPSNYVEGVGATLPVNPPKTDYTFRGWYDNAGLTGTPVTEISTEARGPQTFWGRWTSNSGTEIPYRDASGTPQEAFCVPITSSTTALAGGWYYVSGTVSIPRGITISEAVNIVLCDSSTFTVYNDYGPAITVEGTGNSLTIFGQTAGSGVLAATSDSGAGIGSSNNYALPCGDITINGGVITATGSNYYPGIGGNCTGGSVTINGGTVTATGGNSGGAGIGGGSNHAGGAVTINGGTVTAQGGSSGGAGIGGGDFSAGGTVTINGGTVTATGGDQGAGIGGCRTAAGGTVTINGGTVTATGGSSLAAGIGSGRNGNQGTLTVGERVTVKAGTSADPTTVLEPDSNGAITLEGQRYFVVEGPSIVPGVSSITYIGRDGETPILGLVPATYMEGTATNLPASAAVEAEAPGYTFGGWYATAALTEPAVTEISAAATGPQTVYAKLTPINYSIAYYDGASPLVLAPSSYTVESGDVNLPEATPPTGYVFGGWCVESDCSDTPTRTISAGSVGNKTFYAKWIDEAEAGMARVTFISASGAEQESLCKVLTTDITELSNGWYVVEGEVVYPVGGITVIGNNVNLVLKDGASLVVTGATHKAGVNVASGNALTIYGQSGDTGALTAFGGLYGAGIGGNENETCGTVTINGGTITAKYGNDGAGIGGGKSGNGGAVTINGGSVLSDGGLLYGIGGGRGATDHGTLTVGEYVTVSVGNSKSSLTPLTPDEYGSITLQDKEYYKAVTKRPKNISYRKADGTTGNAFCTLVDADTTMLSNDWYVVMGDLAVNKSISVYGDVKLILCDGVTFNVTANSGPGIYVPTDTSLTIYGQGGANLGILNATGGDYCPGIGGRSSGGSKDCGSVTINGVEVTATGSTFAAGIGGADGGAGGTVTINGGDVTATAGSNYASGIGGASGKGDGTLIIGPQMVAKAGAAANPGQVLDYDLETGRVTFSGKKQYFTVKVNPEAPAVHTITYRHGDVVLTGLAPTKYRVGTGAALPANVDRVGYVFLGWYDNPGLSGTAVTGVSTTDNEDKTFYGRFLEPTSSITFVGADGAPQTETCTLLTTNITELGNSWYYVDGELDYGKGISVSGAAKIVLKDGATLTANGRGNDYEHTMAKSPGISVPYGSSLAIYAQSNGASAGVLNATGYYPSAAGIGGAQNVNCGDVTIYGGVVTATGGYGAAGIGGGSGGNGGAIAIYGGDVTATSDGDAVGIGGGSGAADHGTLTVGDYVAVYAGANAELATEKTPQAGTISRGDNEPYYRAVSDLPQMIAYCEPDGTENNALAKILNEGALALVEGWYAVTNRLILPLGGLTIQGDVKLILADGAMLAVTGVLSSAGITVTNDNKLTIFGQEDGTGELIATGDGTAAGIGGGSGAVVGTVVVNGGTIEATGGSNGAGIGGGYQSAGGTVIVSNGVVTAIGGMGGAGIGGGYQGAGGAVTICGGMVTAEGASGIGGGNSSSGHGTLDVHGNVGILAGASSSVLQEKVPDSNGLITLGGEAYYKTVLVETPNIDYIAADGTGASAPCKIVVAETTTLSGGWYAVTNDLIITHGLVVSGHANLILCDGVTLSVTGGFLEPGIAVTDDSSVSLTIYGQSAGEGAGALEATGANRCAGIGGGNSGAGGSVTINGGTVTATGGDNGAGIGGGNGGACGTVTVNGGMVTATGGGNFAAGIGGGSGGNGGTVVVNGGEVTAQGGLLAAGIGGGNGSSSHGTLRIGSSLAAMTGDSMENLGEVIPVAGMVELDGKPCCKVVAGEQKVEASYRDIDGENKLVECRVVSPLVSTIASGWYAVTNDVVFPDSLIIKGDVSLILYDGATLTVTGGASCAGIVVTNGASLTIYGQSLGTGRLNAVGDGEHLGGAGIGGSYNAAGGTITINGGKVTATGGYHSAGIGGGYNGACGSVTVNGGEVVATGGDDAAGLGGGSNGACGMVTINGGSVTATGCSYGSGIGLGKNGTGGSVTVNGGEVAATGGEGGAGIGGGASCAVSIYGGEVTANGGRYGAGIGGCHGSAGGTVVVSNGVVTAAGGMNGAGIGGGENGAGGSVTIYCGIVTATSGVDGAGIGGGKNGNGGTVAINGGTVVAKGLYVSAGIGGGANASSQGTLTVGADVLFMAGNSESTLTVKQPSASGVITLESLNFCKSITVVPQSVYYRDASGTVVSEPVLATPLVAVVNALSSGWYVATEDVAFNAGVTVSGDVKLILVGGKTVTVENGNGFAGINVPSGASLTIYQASGEGTGVLEVSGGNNGAGIGGNNGQGCGSVTVVGGKVIVTGGASAAGIGGGYNGDGGTVAINGGDVSVASGSSFASGIGKGYGGSDDGTLTVATTLRARSGEYEGGMKTMERDSVDPTIVTLDGKMYFWASAAQTCTITYYDGETQLTTLAPATYGEGVVTALPGRSVMTKAGKTFAGWCDDPGCKTKAVLSLGADDAGDKVLYADWVDINPISLDLGTTATGASDSTVITNLATTINCGSAIESIKFTVTEGRELPAALYLSGSNLCGSFADPGLYTIPVTVTDTTPPKTMEDLGKKPQSIDLEYTIVVTGEHKEPTFSFGIADNSLLVSVNLNGHTAIVIPDGVTAIDLQAFFMWKNALKTLTIPPSVTNIASSAFSSASNLKTIHVAHGDTTRISGLLTGSGFNVSGVEFIEDPAVTFAMNDGTGSTTVRLVSYGETVGTLPVPVRAHATFNGWFTTADGGTAVTGAEIVTDDVTYYAHWTMEKVTVRFKKNDGSYATVAERSVDFGSAVGELPTATRDGYRLVGWFTEEEGGDQISASTLVEDTYVYYYAHWAEQSAADWPADTSTVASQTAGEAFEITGNLANVNAKVLADWAKGVGNVDYADKGDIIPNAFLLNCANNAAAVATATVTASAAIKITAITFDASGNPVLTYPAIYGNGQVVLQGSATIGTSASWHDGKQSTDRFFRTVLKFK